MTVCLILWLEKIESPSLTGPPFTRPHSLFSGFFLTNPWKNGNIYQYMGESLSLKDGDMKRATRAVVFVSIVCLLSVNWTFASATCPSADLNEDCYVTIEDLFLLCDEWPDVYDFNDFADMADQWYTGNFVQGVANQVSQMDYMIYHDDIESCGWGLYGGASYINPGNERNRDGWEGIGTPGNQEARLYIQDQFTAMGLDVSVQGSYLNVIGELTGTTTPDNVYIIGGHYDHTSGDMPGGDDNASGTAGVLEAARAMSQYEFESTILFMCFNAEEDGLKGSADYVASLTPTEKNNIQGMINMDMILRPGSDAHPERPIDVEIETVGFLPWVNYYVQAIADYVPTIVVGDIWNSGASSSDNDSFREAGIPSFLLIENSDNDWYPPDQANPYYHTTEDASDRLANNGGSPEGITYDYAFATDVVRAAVALTAQEAGLVPSITIPPDTIPPTPNPAAFASAPSADGTTDISMTATTGTDATYPVEYLFTETSGNSGGTSSGWQVSASYTDAGLTPGTMYTYTVTMRDGPGNTGTPSAGASATTDVGLINVVLETNGGVLESFTSEYGSGYEASLLTNGVTDEAGWASVKNPDSSQEFVYSFSGGNSAILSDAVVHGGTAEGGGYYSENVEVWISTNGTDYTEVDSGILDDSPNDSLLLDLADTLATNVKLVITSGYRSDYWELAEFEVNGNIVIP
jgi:hypothetical protein